MDASSTLNPAQVAVVMVEQAVAKHNTRYDKTFLKAVSHNLARLCMHPFISILLLGPRWCYVVLRWPL